ncbi:hypothetical protein C8Q80DRAFT_1127284 [Daedaleopsis nitida]|nr:hypothetical protein C8Q80DRAFT_1127284 [Daedaleopsis nitida]
MLRSLSQKLAEQNAGYGHSGGLPTASDRHGHVGYRRQSWWAAFWSKPTQRVIRIVMLAALCAGLVHLFWGDTLVGLVQDRSKPPLYRKYHEAELRLPQHDPELQYPEGKHGQFIWYANHVHGSGWGNAMQEHLLNAHLAHESGRAFVFNNYTWNKDGSDHTDFNGHLIPSRIPISAILRGPTAGRPWPVGDYAPRAVVKEYWDTVCPEKEVMTEELFKIDAEADAGVVLDAWVEKLKAMPRCVEIDEKIAQIWNIWMFGSKRILGIWDSLKRSPVITEFRWSQLIEDGFVANYRLFSSTSWLVSLFSGAPSAYPYTPIPGLLALHIRRGDFEGHCLHFARWSSQWNGFNQFAELPDQFEPPPSAGWGEATPEGEQLYLRRCYPTVAQIVERVAAVRATAAGQGLRNVYIMTNAKKPWITELKGALWKMGGWEKIASSRDLSLGWEQQFVAQSVDMLIGQRAQVIIGNGFSSLTSNIVMLRMALDIPADTNRFW